MRNKYDAMFDHLPTKGEPNEFDKMFDHLPNEKPVKGPVVPKVADEFTFLDTPNKEKGMFDRFTDAASKGFNTGFGKKPVFDAVPTQYFPPSHFPAVTNAYNHVANTVVDSGEGLLRGLAGTIRAGTHVAAQGAQELGMSEGDAGRLERDLMGLIDTAGIMTVGANVASQGAKSINKAQRQAGRIKDVKAYDKLELEPFAPTLTDTPVIGNLSHVASKVPFAGAPVRDTATDLLTNVSASAKKVVNDLSPSKIDSLEEGGDIIQKGLKRFSSEKTYYKPIEELSDQELKKLVVHESSNSLSFATKQEAMYESAWRKLPPRFKSNGSKNPDLVSTANSRKVLQNIERLQKQIGVSGGALQGKFSGMAEKLRNRGNLEVSTLRNMRTEVGRMLGRGPDDNVNMDRKQLKELYGAITQDITSGFEKIAHRAASDPAISNAGTVKAFQAVRAFKRADQFTKKGIERLDNLLELTKAKTPEKAASRIMSAALSSGQGNLGLLRAAKKSLRKDEWSDFSSLVLNRIGTPKPGVKGLKQELEFSPATFATEWNKLSDQGKHLIFGGKGTPSREAIDALVRVSDRIGGLESLANHSNTTNQAITALSSLGVLGTVTGQLPKFLGVLAGTYGYSKLVSSPKFARWLARSAELSANPNFERLWASQLSQLQMMVKEDPELRPFLEILEERGKQEENSQTN
ncbi:MAG: hypothetical protein DHS20C07_19200 [Methyloligella sp.]|nr:MAG: hypothetical protein DHS20C07_19200 [Methyloligella sp.]